MNIKLSVLLIMAIALGFVSCKKGDDSIATVQTTNLIVVNATTDTLNYYLNGARINTASSLYPLGSSGYVGVAVGKQNYQFKKPRSPIVLLDLPLALDTGNVYSLFVAGRTAAETFLAVDTLVADTNGRAKVRFVNASPDAGNLTVLVGDTVNFKVRAFKTATVFLPVNAGAKHVRVYQAGSTVPIVDETRTLLGGQVYTLFTRGKLAGTGNGAFGTGLVVNR